MANLQILAQHGIKEISDFFDLADSIYNAVKAAKADNGKIDFPGDLGLFLNVPVLLFTAIAGADQVPDEWRDLDNQEEATLAARFGKYNNDPAFIGLVGDLISVSVNINKLLTKQAA